MNPSTINTFVEKAITELPPVVQQAFLTNNATYHYLAAKPVHAICQQMHIDQETLGLMLLPLAAAYAVTPISNFSVGAVAFDSEGNAYLGANFEFSHTHIGQTIHAEQSAIANAWNCGATDLALLVINYPPCGHCRQFINEVNLAANFRIQLPDSRPQPLSYYLPNAFGPSDLGITSRILQQKINTQNASDLALAATIACHASHAPYSGNHCGIALQYDDDMIVGCYGENAAFNPSLPPLQMALNTRRLQGKDWQTVRAATLCENTAEITQRQHAEQLLAGFSAVTLNYLNQSI